ncbi:hypothetical protein [Micrococcus luteus]|jgi:hypothetical protein|nr:hypothetical protein [Micrococcus luteus]MCV7527112.1 hypothetical protein [Micrococcus luteus]SJN17011.1 hypothetical protein FM117_00645 [Micrococcus luteus Mu201]
MAPILLAPDADGSGCPQAVRRRRADVVVGVLPLAGNPLHI